MAGLISDDHLMNGMMNHGSPLSGSGPFDQPKTPLNPFGDEGIECEQYAVKLDELLPEKGADAETVWSRAMQLAREYHSMARSTLDSLQRQRGIATAAQSGSRREVEDVNMDLQELEDTRSPTGADDLARLNETIRDWQLESQTWDIFESMSSELYSKPQRDRSSTKVPQDQLLNSSLPTSEQQLQKLFFLGDDRARTRAIVLEWLKRSAASERDSIDDTLDKWASQADQNINIVSQGWLDTREEIKRQKRSTGQVGPIALQNAGQSFDGTNGTITQLDPDAITRQQRSLQPADQAYESYVWMGCYEMLRRGQSWEEIRQWCQDKKEGWRAVSMGGEAIDWDWSVSNLDSTQHLVVSDSYSQAGSQGSNARLKSRFLWRVMCLATARRSGGNAYERASYGILSGDLTVVKAVSTDWNDALFAHLNASLHQGFTTFVATNYPTLLPDSTALRGLRLEDDTTPSAGSEEMSSLADRLRRSMTLADDIDSPFKNIQAAIISDSIGSEVARLTETILLSSFKAQPSTNGHRQSLMNHKPSYPTNGEPSSAAPNAQLLRVLVHVALLHNLLTHKNRTSHTQDEGVAQLIELYVKHLHSDGKLDMIPLYASLLPESKQKLLLGSIVIRIGDRLSKENFLNLMELNGMDVKAVVTEEIRRSISELKFPDLNDTRASPFIKCLVDDVNDSSEVGCGVKNIELGTELDTEDLILIQSLEWLLYIDGVLAETFERGADLYAYFYTHCKLAAAHALLSRVKSTTIIQLKGDQICEDQQELKSIVDELLPGNDFETPNSPILPEFPSSTQPSPSDRRSAILLLSRRYRQFEQLTRSIATIPAVRKAAEQKPANVKDMSWKKTVKSACDACALETEPLLRDWLKPPRSELAVAGRAAASFIRSERSSTDLQTALDAYLRAVYLPELILALNRVYVYAANYVTRDLLPPALDLASTIASPEAELAACFAASGRLPELAAALARGSRQFMAADALQGRDRPREQFRGVKHRLGMWRVRLEEEQGSGERRNAFAERARRGEPGARLSAFGHGLEVDLRTQAPIVAE